MGLTPKKSHGLGDATGARSGPLAKIVLYYKTHLAVAVVLDEFRSSKINGAKLRLDDMVKHLRID